MVRASIFPLKKVSYEQNTELHAHRRWQHTGISIWKVKISSFLTQSKYFVQNFLQPQILPCYRDIILYWYDCWDLYILEVLGPNTSSWTPLGPLAWLCLSLTLTHLTNGCTLYSTLDGVKCNGLTNRQGDSRMMYSSQSSLCPPYICCIDIIEIGKCITNFLIIPNITTKHPGGSLETHWFTELYEHKSKSKHLKRLLSLSSTEGMCLSIFNSTDFFAESSMTTFIGAFGPNTPKAVDFAVWKIFAKLLLFSSSLVLP